MTIIEFTDAGQAHAAAELARRRLAEALKHIDHLDEFVQRFPLRVSHDGSRPGAEMRDPFRETRELREALKDAAHRVRWLMQFVTDTAPIEAELAKWDALAAAK